MKLFFNVILLLSLFYFINCDEGCVTYLSLTGNGTICNQTEPCLTFQEAMQYCESINSTKIITVNFGEGTWIFNQTAFSNQQIFINGVENNTIFIMNQTSDSLITFIDSEITDIESFIELQFSNITITDYNGNGSSLFFADLSVSKALFNFVNCQFKNLNDTIIVNVNSQIENLITVSFSSCQFYENFGATLVYSIGSQISFNSTSISGNTLGNQALIYVESSSLLLDSQIENNIKGLENITYSIMVSTESTFNITSGYFGLNQVDYILYIENNDPTENSNSISNVFFFGNTATNLIYISNSTLVIEQSIIRQNTLKSTQTNTSSSINAINSVYNENTQLNLNELEFIQNVGNFISVINYQVNFKNLDIGQSANSLLFDCNGSHLSFDNSTIQPGLNGNSLLSCQNSCEINQDKTSDLQCESQDSKGSKSNSKDNTSTSSSSDNPYTNSSRNVKLTVGCMVVSLSGVLFIIGIYFYKNYKKNSHDSQRQYLLGRNPYDL